jgi:uncharacterized membrane protein
LKSALRAAACLAALAAVAAGSGCATGGATPAAAPASAARAELPRVITWDCGGQRVDAWRLDGAIELVAGERQWRLPQVPAASGARHADATSWFWSKGQASALLSLDGSPAIDCAPSAEPSAWAAAAARGMRLRALGAEPDWVLEYTPGDQFVFTRRDGESLRLPAAGGGSTPARGAADGRTIEVETLPGPCGDGMSDLAYEFGVRVRIDGGAPLAGCGRALY